MIGRGGKRRLASKVISFRSAVVLRRKRLARAKRDKAIRILDRRGLLDVYMPDEFFGFDC